MTEAQPWQVPAPSGEPAGSRPEPARESADEARALAERIKAHMSQAGAADEHAYAMLFVDGECRPWTLEAEKLWQGSDSTRRSHHLAVAQHSRAYDLESQGQLLQAHVYWRAGLRAWAAVVADDAFWREMAEHLARVAPGEDVAEVVGDLRAELPRMLAEVNLARAVELSETDPEAAGRHLTAIRESRFPAELVEELRRSYAEQGSAEAMAAVRAGRYNEGITPITARLAVDPTNPRLVELLLYAVRQTLSNISTEERWAQRNRGFLQRIQQAVRPYEQEAGIAETGRISDRGTGQGPSPEILRELARFEFMLGIAAIDDSKSSGVQFPLEVTAGAVRHFDRALALDPLLSDDAQFSAVTLLRDAHNLACAYFALQLRRGDAAVRTYLTRALETYGPAPDPEVGQPEIIPVVVAQMAAPTQYERGRAQRVANHLLRSGRLSRENEAVLGQVLQLLNPALRFAADYGYPPPPPPGFRW